jgi:HK97 gp10 family phage protein
MADQITFDLNGFSELYKKFKDINDKAKNEVKSEFNASALKIQNDAKKMAPVNFGNLRNLIVLTEDGDTKNFSYTVGARASYSPYVEFGTGGKVSVPNNYQEYASKFKGKGGGTFKEMIEALTLWVRRKGIGGKNDKSTAYLIARSILKNGLKPQPFLIPAFEQEKPKLLKRIKEILNA